MGVIYSNTQMCSKPDSYCYPEKRSESLQLSLGSCGAEWKIYMLSAGMCGAFKTEECVCIPVASVGKGQRQPLWQGGSCVHKLCSSLLLLTFPRTLGGFSSWSLNLEMSPCVAFHLKALSLSSKTSLSLSELFHFYVRLLGRDLMCLRVFVPRTLPDTHTLHSEWSLGAALPAVAGLLGTVLGPQRPSSAPEAPGPP